jgi:hypothetical protein
MIIPKPILRGVQTIDDSWSKGSVKTEDFFADIVKTSQVGHPGQSISSYEDSFIIIPRIEAGQSIFSKLDESGV